MTVQPEGTVTFMFTDIEGSTRLLLQVGENYISVLENQRRLMREIFRTYKGHEEDTEGDSFFVSFSRAIDAVGAASEIQRTLANTEWPGEQEVKVRIGLHTGEPWFDRDRFVGIDIHLAQRISAVGYGGQVLLSETTAALIRDRLPAGINLIDLGRHRLKDIEQPERISQLAIQGLPSDYPPLRSVEAVDAVEPVIRHNLPMQSTPFVGRFNELTDLEKLLEKTENHLVTIVGPGGMGKTRLALAYAERHLKTQPTRGSVNEPQYPDGVFFVSLDELNSAEHIVPQIAQSLGLRLTSSTGGEGGMAGPERTPKEQVLDYLSNKQLLLLMDNFEHLLEGATLLVEVRKSAPEVKILATSRTRLGVHGEQLYPLHGLRSPAEDDNDISAQEAPTKYSAVQLFVQAAKRHEPGYTLAPNDLMDLARLCQMVDGLPLALELAAGWTGMISLSDTVAELSKDTTLLETDMVDIPERHRSMDAVFQSTWARLETDDQDLFSQLCIFRGGFTREAAYEVTGATLRQLASLLNKSLLLYDRRIDRYRIHRLLRQFGNGLLAKDPVSLRRTRERYCTFFCDRMAQWGELLKAGGQQEAFREMESDIQNIETAWNLSVAQGYLDGLNKSIDAFHTFHIRSSHVYQVDEAFELAEDMLEGKEDPIAKLVLAKLLARKGWILEDVLDLALVERSLSLIADIEESGVDVRAGKAFALIRRASLMSAALEELEKRQDDFRYSLSIYQELDDTWGIALALQTKGDLAFKLGQYKEARLLNDQSLQLRRAIGDRQGEIESLQSLAVIARYTGELNKAQELEEHCILLLRQESNLLALADSLLNHCITLFWSGEFQESRVFFAERNAIYINLGLSRMLQFSFMDEMNDLFLGDYECLEKFPEIEKQISWALPYWLLMAGMISVVKRQYSQAREDMAKALELVRERQVWNDFGVFASWLSIAIWHTGDKWASKRQMHEALGTTIRKSGFPSLTHTLPIMALILAQDGQAARAVEVYEAALQFPHVANAQLFEDVVGMEIATIANSLDGLVVEKARQKGRERDPWALAEELLADLEVELAGADQL